MNAAAVTAGRRVGRSRSAVRFTLALIGFGLALAVLYRSPRLYGALAPLDPVVARATASLVSAGGMAVERHGAVLAHPDGFRYEIYYRCTGLLVAAFLVAGLAALPGRPRAKLLAALAGAALVAALNFGRLVALYWIGVHHPAAFDFAHRVVGEAGMIAAVVAFWGWWLRRASGTYRVPSPLPPPVPLSPVFPEPLGR